MKGQCAAIASIVCNIILSVFLVLVNKQITSLYNFRFMTVLTGFHFTTSFLSCLLFLLFGCMRYKAVNNFSSIFRISLASMLSIIFMNYNLAYSSIGFYQISKLFCIPVTLLIESMFNLRQQSLTWFLGISLFFIIVGMCLVAEQEVLVNSTGCMWALLGVVATSSAQIFFGPLKKDLGLDSIQLLFHTSPWLSFGSFISIPLLENTRELYLYSNQGVVLSIVLSCLLAVAFNVSNYVLLGMVTPMSYTVLSHVKTIVIIAVGSYLFEAAPTARVSAGMALAMVGVVLYSAEVQRQQQAQHSQQQSPKGQFADGADSKAGLALVRPAVERSRRSAASDGSEDDPLLHGVESQC